MMLLIFLLFLFSHEPIKSRQIAILVRPLYRGEISFAHRIQTACQNLDWEADIVDIERPRALQTGHYDFVINLVPGDYRHPKCQNYMALFDPCHNYFKKNGSLSAKYRCYDGYLLSYAPGKKDPNFTKGHHFPYMQWYPTVHRREYCPVNPANLFHICCAWGNRFEDSRFRECLNLLNRETYTRFHGSELFQPLYTKSYQGMIPYEGEDLFEMANQAGVALVLHSCIHNAHGIPSGRIFEAAAASAVIISDQNGFVQSHFGDSVLYIDTNQSGEAIYRQIHAHMHWIQANRTAAQELGKRAHAIYREKFLLEDQLLRLEKFHNRLLVRPKHILQNGWKKCYSIARLMFQQLWSVCHLSANTITIDPIPIATIPNANARFSLINSIDFHPQKNLFCATYTHNNQVIFYKVNPDNKLQLVESLENPISKLSEPQHAIFSPDGNRVVVANWTNQTFAFYRCDQDAILREPIAIISPPEILKNYKPHGMAFSPCGGYLAVAYGAASYHGRGIALFRVIDRKRIAVELVSVLKGEGMLPGIPKGIAFSPDGTCLLVTFSDTNSLALYEIDPKHHTIEPVPKQTLSGIASKISRPEDVKVSPDGKYCAISNSDQNTVTIYPFDSKMNLVLQSVPCSILENPTAKLCFPHGIAFSHDGAFLGVTQFGPIQSTEAGDIVWDEKLAPSTASINLYPAILF